MHIRPHNITQIQVRSFGVDNIYIYYIHYAIAPIRLTICHINKYHDFVDV